MGIFWRRDSATMAELVDRPAHFGRYTLVGRLAVGGMAEVYAAKQASAVGFERLVALKVIHPHLVGERDFVAMFIDEARIAMHLRHSNIVPVLDLAEEGGAYALAMDWVDGVDLGEAIGRLREGQRIFPPELIAYVVAESAKALHHAHTATDHDGQRLEIVHRDVSPANILVSFDGEVKVTDFGIAKAKARITQTRPGVVKGKFAYIAPEAYDGHPVDRRSDVFGLGVVLYELLTGVNPFRASNPAEIIFRVRSGKVIKPRELVPVYEPLEAIALAALALRPEDRPQTADELARALGDALADLAADRGAFVRPTALADRIRMAFPERGLPRLGRPAIPSDHPTEDFAPRTLVMRSRYSFEPGPA